VIFFVKKKFFCEKKKKKNTRHPYKNTHASQKLTYITNNPIISYQKHPIYPQKTPFYHQKCPISYKKRTFYTQPSAPFRPLARRSSRDAINSPRDGFADRSISYGMLGFFYLNFRLFVCFSFFVSMYISFSSFFFFFFCSHLFLFNKIKFYK
jgi:hypothetical protein